MHQKSLVMRIFLLTISSLICLTINGQTTYYVDNLIGDDYHEGTLMTKPFKTLKRINSVILEPGDTVLFRRGGAWTGNFLPKGSGSKDAMIVIGAYGNGPAPELDARGKVKEGEKVSHTVRLYNQEYIEIRDLKIKNYKPFEVPREIKSSDKSVYVNSLKTGIYIEGRDCGSLNSIRLVNLEICDVNGDMSTKNNGGVFIEISWDDDADKRVKSNFNGLLTEGCYIHDIYPTGWSNTSVWKRRSLNSKWGDVLQNGRNHNWYPSREIVLRNNRFEKAGLNALIVRVADGPLIEHCLFTHNGWKGSGNASYPFNCDNALFQYNEACYTVYNTEADSWNHKKDADAGGFDSDWNCKNTIIQYNYSHHNGFGGILLCNDGNSKTGFNDGTIVRYNVFENNQHHQIRCSGTITNSLIHNNVILSGNSMDSILLVFHKSWGGYSDSTHYINNIFYAKDIGAKIETARSTNTFFTANTFFGSISGEPEDSLKSKLDPRFISSGNTISNYKEFLKFMLQHDSPEINRGITVKDHPEKDFIGNFIDEYPDRGAFEFQ